MLAIQKHFARTFAVGCLLAATSFGVEPVTQHLVTTVIRRTDFKSPEFFNFELEKEFLRLRDTFTGANLDDLILNVRETKLAMYGFAGAASVEVYHDLQDPSPTNRVFDDGAVVLETVYFGYGSPESKADGPVLDDDYSEKKIEKDGCRVKQKLYVYKLTADPQKGTVQLTDQTTLLDDVMNPCDQRAIIDDIAEKMTKGRSKVAVEGGFSGPMNRINGSRKVTGSLVRRQNRHRGAHLRLTSEEMEKEVYHYLFFQQDPVTYLFSFTRSDIRDRATSHSNTRLRTGSLKGTKGDVPSRTKTLANSVMEFYNLIGNKMVRDSAHVNVAIAKRYMPRTKIMITNFRDKSEHGGSTKNQFHVTLETAFYGKAHDKGKGLKEGSCRVKQKLLVKKTTEDEEGDLTSRVIKSRSVLDKVLSPCDRSIIEDEGPEVIYRKLQSQRNRLRKSHAVSVKMPEKESQQ